MHKLALVVTLLVSLLFLGAGGGKVFLSYEDFAEQAAWATELEPWQVTVVGVLELLAAVGLLLALRVRALRWVTIAAPAGLALLMAGAIGFHVVIGDGAAETMPSVVAFILSAVLLWLRLGPARVAATTPASE